MKAVLLTGHGGLEKLEYREDVPTPEPAEGEVLIAVGAAGINNTDIWTREGAYGTEDDPATTSGWRRGNPMRFPRIQGADIVGRIVGVGGGVNASRIGERVIVDNALYSGGEEELVDSGLIGSERDGGFAEYVAVSAENAHAIESNLSDAELATFLTAYVTSLRMLNRARVSAGETVLVTGASGGVGSGLVQLARLRGARVIALVGSGKEDQARALGTELVITRDTRNLPAAVAKAAGGRPIDVVADVVGGDVFADLLNVLRPMGRYVSAGAIAGPVVRLDPKNPLPQAARTHRLDHGHPRGVRQPRGAYSLRQDKAAPRTHLPAVRPQASSERFHEQELFRQASNYPEPRQLTKLCGATCRLRTW